MKKKGPELRARARARVKTAPPRAQQWWIGCAELFRAQVTGHRPARRLTSAFIATVTSLSGEGVVGWGSFLEGVRCAFLGGSSTAVARDSCLWSALLRVVVSVAVGGGRVGAGAK